MSRIVEMHDEGPLMIDPDEEDSTVAVCRCGLSNNWPYCDGSHGNTADEDDGTVYRYTRPDGDELERDEVTEIDPGDADPRS